MDDSEEIVATADDWLVAQFAYWAELGIKSGVTLLVQGAIISGRLESEADYMLNLRAAFSSGMVGPVEIGEAVDQFFKNRMAETPQREPGAPPPPTPNYIHMSHAGIFAPGQPALPNNQSLWLRIRITDVSGISLGVFGAK